jgi:inhibitor of cysteine peptidase
MKRDTMIPVVLGTILAVGLCLPAAAELCKDCRDQAYVLSVGACTSCGRETRSGAFKLCPKCSAEQGRCEHCLALLAVEPEQPDKQPPKPKPIDLNKAGAYSSGKWTYRLEITSAGTRNEGKRGQLVYDGKSLPSAEVNDHYQTPWGMIYWVGNPQGSRGLHGWMPSPLSGSDRKGKLLASPGQPQVVKLDAGDDGKTVTMLVGQTLEISLAGNITTGYSWQIDRIGGKAVESLGEPSYVTDPHAPGIAGVGGTFTFRLKAGTTGTATLRLIYVRPWETDQPPEDTFEVTIKVQADGDQPAEQRGSGKEPGSPPK